MNFNTVSRDLEKPVTTKVPTRWTVGDRVVYNGRHHGQIVRVGAGVGRARPVELISVEFDEPILFGGTRTTTVGFRADDVALAATR